MGKSQRTKGAVGEREVAAIFSAALGKKFERNIGQARDGGNDIDVGPLVVEVKRRKTLGTILGWFRQCVSSALTRELNDVVNEQPRAYPIVAFREDGGEWMAMLRLADFLALARTELLQQIDSAQ